MEQYWGIGRDGAFAGLASFSGWLGLLWVGLAQWENQMDATNLFGVLCWDNARTDLTMLQLGLVKRNMQTLNQVCSS